ncbi:MAG TPA: VOC family protein [Candidatus Acidoferrum sp.]|jgi:uncharacterized glyoxalase superfamily protein PhnB
MTSPLLDSAWLEPINSVAPKKLHFHESSKEQCYYPFIVKNRSVPTDTILPHVMYRDVEEAIAWLTRVFGFTEHYHHGDPSGPISGAQMYLGNAYIMLKRARPGCASPEQLGYGTQSLTIFVDDIDSHFQKAKAGGATILEEPHETVYGERQYAATDQDGHHWLFSKHARDLSPEQWGATLTKH